VLRLVLQVFLRNGIGPGEDERAFVSAPLLVQPDKVLDVQHVLVLEGLLLVDVSVLGVENLGIASVHHVLDNVSELIHLGLVLLIESLLHGELLLLLVKLLALLSVLPHHVLLPYLVEPFAHLLNLIFDTLKSF